MIKLLKKRFSLINYENEYKILKNEEGKKNERISSLEIILNNEKFTKKNFLDINKEIKKMMKNSGLKFYFKNKSNLQSLIYSKLDFFGKDENGLNLLIFLYDEKLLDFNFDKYLENEIFFQNIEEKIFRNFENYILYYDFVKKQEKTLLKLKIFEKINNSFTKYKKILDIDKKLNYLFFILKEKKIREKNFEYFIKEIFYNLKELNNSQIFLFSSLIINNNLQNDEFYKSIEKIFLNQILEINKINDFFMFFSILNKNGSEKFWEESTLIIYNIFEILSKNEKIFIMNSYFINQRGLKKLWKKFEKNFLFFENDLNFLEKIQIFKIIKEKDLEFENIDFFILETEIFEFNQFKNIHINDFILLVDFLFINDILESKKKLILEVLEVNKDIYGENNCSYIKNILDTEN